MERHLPLTFPSSCLSQNLRWKDSNRFVWTEGLQALFVFQRLGKGGAPSGSRVRCGSGRGPGQPVSPTPRTGCCCRWAVGRRPRPPGGPAPAAPPQERALLLPQRPCSTVTSTSAQPCGWATPASTRTRHGCARSSRRSEGDLSLVVPLRPAACGSVRGRRPGPGAQPTGSGQCPAAGKQDPPAQIPVPGADSRTCLVPLALGSAPLLPAPGALAGSGGTPSIGALCSTHRTKRYQRDVLCC